VISGKRKYIEMFGSFTEPFNLTGALHVLWLQLSPPLPLSLAPIKLANLGTPGKMAIKTQ